MTSTDTAPSTAAPYYDPYDVEINLDPYPAFKALRDEAPVYYNDVHDFYALSRFDDIAGALRNHQTFISGKGGILELIKAGIEMPPGILIFEDPPTHTAHRRLLSRVFSPRRVAELEPKVRDFTVRCLDPLVGRDGFDIIADLAAQVPMKTISMLLGIPESDQEAIRDKVDRNLRTEEGKPMEVREDFVSGEMFAEYIDWRAANPSDDLMTDLLNATFEDHEGNTRTLTRDEILTYVNVVAGAGNETTNRLIGWAGKILGEHPDQRRELVGDHSLIPNAIEEILRYEGPAPHVGRYVAHDIELHGTTIPAGNAILLLLGAGNRDERKFEDPDRFDIHREIPQLMSFGYGIHFCLGAALARMEGRIVLEELLARFPDWTCDLGNARLSPTSTVRGWETLPPSFSAGAFGGDVAPTTTRSAASRPTGPATASSSAELAMLARESDLRDWGGVTIAAVAERAEVSERTVYRHVGSEDGLRQAVMAQIERSAGIDLSGLDLAGVADAAALIFEQIAAFRPPAQTDLDPTLRAAGERQRAAPCARRAPRRPSGPEGRPASAWRAVLDVLWSPPPTNASVTDWHDLRTPPRTPSPERSAPWPRNRSGTCTERPPRASDRVVPDRFAWAPRAIDRPASPSDLLKPVAPPR